MRKNKKLKMVMAGSDMTNYELELKANLPLTKLSRIIHGAVEPSQSEKEAIAQALNKPIAELFTNPGSPVVA